MEDGGGHDGWKRTWRMEDMEDGGHRGHGGWRRAWWVEEDIEDGGHGRWKRG